MIEKIIDEHLVKQINKSSKSFFFKLCIPAFVLCLSKVHLASASLPVATSPPNSEANEDISVKEHAPLWHISSSSKQTFPLSLPLHGRSSSTHRGFAGALKLSGTVNVHHLVICAIRNPLENIHPFNFFFFPSLFPPSPPKEKWQINATSMESHKNKTLW